MGFDLVHCRDQVKDCRMTSKVGQRGTFEGKN